MKDIQKTHGGGIDLNWVGVNRVDLPIEVKTLAGSSVSTIGRFFMAVNLSGEFKGTHMSRFTQVLMERVHGQVLDSSDFSAVAKELVDRLGSDRSRLEVTFPYFLVQRSPVTNLNAIAPYEARIVVQASKGESETRQIVGVKVVGQTCCPCSKLISDYDEDSKRGKGAHSQRGNVSVEVCYVQEEGGEFVWLEQLIDIAQASVSAPAYPLLKREDERYATISAYENPCFVEDVGRRAYEGLEALRALKGYEWGFRIGVENEETIHYHNAVTEIRHQWDDLLN